MDINSMQKELDNLKEILSGQITLDTSLVSSLFNIEDGLPNMNLFNETLLNHEEVKLCSNLLKPPETS